MEESGEASEWNAVWWEWGILKRGKAKPPTWIFLELSVMLKWTLKSIVKEIRVMGVGEDGDEKDDRLLKRRGVSSGKEEGGGGR